MDGYNTPLTNRIIRLRPGFKNLTHRHCSKKNFLKLCEEYEVEEFELNSELVKLLSDLNFVCKVYEKRWKPCDRGGFAICHVTYSGGIFGKWKKRNVEEIFVSSEIDNLTKGGMKCFNYKVFNFDDM